MTKFFRIAGVLAALCLRAASGAGISFASVPANGVIDASAGGFNGWGFDITDTTDFISLDSTVFNLTSVNGVPETGGFPDWNLYGSDAESARTRRWVVRGRRRSCSPTGRK